MRNTVLALVLVGCVPKGRYEITQVQLEATRTAFSARSGQCVEDATAADQRIAELQAEITARQTQLDELVVRAEQQSADLNTLAQERLQLVDQLGLLRAQVDALQLVLASKKKPPTPLPPSPVEALAREEVSQRLAAQERAETDGDRVRAAQRNTGEAFATLAAAGKVEVADDQEAVVVRIPTRLLFQEGFTTLSPRGEALIAEIRAALTRIPGRWITIEGHTDDRKVHTAEFPSNWERGFSHALAVLRAIDGDADVDAKIGAASFADTRPLVPNDTAEHRERNERVELRIVLDPGLTTRYLPTPPPEPELPAPEPAPPSPSP